LGHPYQLSGRVVRGDQRGRTIGYPTANLTYDDTKLIPAGGIYACRAAVLGESFRAAVNIGTNPTFTPDKQTLNVEAYLLDFDQEVYGESVRLDFEVRLRDERRFESVDALVRQIDADVAAVRNVLG
jgi:riboflavin kinase/FMN adenylyltransferase